MGNMLQKIILSIGNSKVLSYMIGAKFYWKTKGYMSYMYFVTDACFRYTLKFPICQQRVPLIYCDKIVRSGWPCLYYFPRYNDTYAMVNCARTIPICRCYVKGLWRPVSFESILRCLFHSFYVDQYGLYLSLL